MPLHRALVATLSVIVAGCAAPVPTSPTFEPTVPSAPALPPGWQVVTSDAGDVRLAVPPDLAVLDLASGILLQGEMAGGHTPIQVWATGPKNAQPQPARGQALRAWLEGAGWVPVEGASGVTDVGDEIEREVWLPAGRALEVTMTVQPGTPEASRVTVYAIETPSGLGVLQILGQAGFFEARRADLALLPLLVGFGEGG